MSKSKKKGKRGSKPRKQAAPQKSTKSRNAFLRYFQETGDELRKVTWPTREDAWRLTLIVLGVTVASMLFLGLLDLLFQQLVALVI